VAVEFVAQLLLPLPGQEVFDGQLFGLLKTHGTMLTQIDPAPT
jgi:hypothetical protein